MKFLAVSPPPPDIYHGWSTRKMFWEENFTPVKMESFGRRNFRKHRENNSGEKYNILDISYTLDCIYKWQVTSSESKDYMGRPGKGLTASLDLRTKRSNKKQKTRFSNIDINNQDVRKLLKKFNNSSYLDYKSKKVHNEPTEAYLFLIK